jgi:hypothetical protein
MVHKRHRMVVLLVAFALVVGVSDEVLVHVGHQVASCVVVVITQEVVDALLGFLIEMKRFRAYSLERV